MIWPQRPLKVFLLKALVHRTQAQHNAGFVSGFLSFYRCWMVGPFVQKCTYKLDYTILYVRKRCLVYDQQFYFDAVMYSNVFYIMYCTITESH